MKKLQGDGMLLRFVTAFTLIPVVLLLIWVPILQSGYILMVVALVLIGSYEFFKMARQADIEVSNRSGIILAVLLALGAGYAEQFPYSSSVVIALVIFVMLLIHLFSLRHTIAGVSTSVFGIFYLGYCGSYFLALHQKPVVGPALVTMLLFTIGLSDTGAYLIGKAVGRHKLAPAISPNKTIEGSAAGLASAALAGALLYGLKEKMGWTCYPAWPITAYMIAGLFLSIVGQLGDLFESLLKRNAGVKDSGIIFPGHGGVLDRCDAFLFGAPAL
ncbi:MAG: phosphatidate cytidylyltransferase, partial [Candidatus Hydrogenedentes bacterium]|nr:phosphatidate cytidylyltransferase [Candidatus Hydrogenedentota bacterium]